MKRLTVILGITLLALIPAGNGAIGKEEREDTISFYVTLHSDAYEISAPDGEGHRIVRMEGFHGIGIPGEPDLPMKVFPILLPPGARVSGLEIVAEETNVLPGSYSIKEAPTPQPITEMGYGPVTPVPRKPEIYLSGDTYPRDLVEKGRAGQLRKYSVQELKFYPVRYRGIPGTLSLTTSVTVKITCRISSRPGEEALRDRSMDDEASSLLYNFDQFREEYAPETTEATLSLVDTVIFVPDALQFSTGLNTLVDYRNGQGHSVQVVNLGSLDVIPGADIPEKIRNYLALNYAAWGIKYVTLVGTHGVIPMRYCNKEQANEPPDYLPTDYYYQDLNGTWSQEEYMCGEDVDPYPEVSVGRIPIDDPEQLEDYVARVIAYEISTHSYKKNALLAAGIWYSSCDAAARAENLRNEILAPNGYSTTRMYEQRGDCPCEWEREADIDSEDAVVNLWADPGYGPYGIVFLAAHGSPSRFSTKMVCPNDGTYINVFSKYQVPLLDAGFPAVIYGLACTTAYPEDSNNIGNVFVRHNAVSYVGSTRVTSTGDKTYDYYFDGLISLKRLNGPALAMARLKTSQYSYSMTYALIDNLYGDPLLDVEGVPGPVIRVEAEDLGFPRTPVGEVSYYTKTMTIEAGGGGFSGNLDGTIALPQDGGFFVKDGSGDWVRDLAFSIPINDAQIFELAFIPAEARSYSDQMVISSNCVLNPQLSFTLTGEGIDFTLIGDTMPPLLTADASPYVIWESLTIEDSVIIEPGVDIYFEEFNDVTLTLANGATVNAIGTEQDPIGFFPYGANATSSIVVQDGSFYLAHCNIDTEVAVTGESVLAAQSSTFDVLRLEELYNAAIDIRSSRIVGAMSIEDEFAASPLGNAFVCRNNVIAYLFVDFGIAYPPTLDLRLENCVLDALTIYNGDVFNPNSLSLHNSIISEHILDLVYTYYGTNPTEIILRYSDIWPDLTEPTAVLTYENAISLDPLFVDAANGDYHLQPGSPCIDAGDPASDYSNEPLPNGDRINIGAYGNTSEATTSPVVDGGWCPWSSCIQGEKFRECACPEPLNGGSECVGPSVRPCSNKRP